MPKIRIALQGVANDYRNSIVPLTIQSLGYEITWSKVSAANLIILGPFYNPKRNFRWIPKPLRRSYQEFSKIIQSRHRPITLFHTAENIRYNHFQADYTISFDLLADSEKHLRLPYWMEFIDWSHEGISGNINPRFGKLLSLDRLMRPQGKAFLDKPKKAAIFASHLREPRSTLIRVVTQCIPVHGFGPSFDHDISHHSKSIFTKSEILKNFGFNLCPENSLYPGYYTEKIPEAFMAETLPITWTDENVCVDFNPNAIINLYPMFASGFDTLLDIINSKNILKSFTEEPLIIKKPSITPLREHLRNILRQATT